MRAPAPQRRAYAMVLVPMFIAMFLAVLSVAFREVAAAIRAVSLQAIHADRDAGSVQAAALAMALLETGLPPKSPYVCVATIVTASGPKSFRVVLTRETGSTWSVRLAPAAPGETLPAMPGTFAAPPP